MKAFPTSMNEGYPQIIQGGMDLRDYFAAMALTTFLIETPVNTSKIIAEKCYAIADEMMKAREK